MNRESVVFSQGAYALFGLFTTGPMLPVASAIKIKVLKQCVLL